MALKPAIISKMNLGTESTGFINAKMNNVSRYDNPSRQWQFRRTELVKWPSNAEGIQSQCPPNHVPPLKLNRHNF